MSPKNENAYLLSSVKNALKILRSFSAEEPQKKISDLADQLGIAKSTASRLMATLASEGFVYKDPETNRYRLGLSVLTLSGIVTSNLEIHTEAVPIINKLVNDIGETVHLVILDDTDVVYIHKAECNHPVRIFTQIGRRNPAYCVSSGKAIIAYQDEALIEKIIRKGLKPFAKNTITDPDELRKELKQVREQGYATSSEEFLEGVASIGVPIRDYTGQVVAAITIVGPLQRVNQHSIPHYTKKLLRTGMEISEKLGYRGA
jgi:DNA-binding IclR family transcriptional regulator